MVEKLKSQRVKKLLARLKREKLSPAHDLNHLMAVAQNCLFLTKIHGGDQEILVAAALLHDLGRKEPTLHGEATRSASIKLAKPFLQKAGFKKGEIKKICQIIADHDQPQRSPRLLEGKILKDADFLDGFGARGILRSFFYTAEAGEDLEKALARLEKMKVRVQGLEFRESKQIAQRQYPLIPFYLSLLKRKTLGEPTFKGKYFCFEGISGTGKETAAENLKKYLQKRGQKVEIVFHPSQRWKKTAKVWRQEPISGMVEAMLLLADRLDSVERFLLPALKKLDFVISLRCFISTLIYQTKTDDQASQVRFLYSLFEPVPDKIFFFDLNPQTALSRVQKRHRETGEAYGKFEKLNLLRQKRARYQKFLKETPDVATIDASQSIEGVFDQLKSVVEKEFL